MDSDSMREEQQRQTNELTDLVRDLLRDHAQKEARPMLGAAISALAHNLGETIGQIDNGKHRKSTRGEAEKVMRRAERTAPKLGNVRAIVLAGKH